MGLLSRTPADALTTNDRTRLAELESTIVKGTAAMEIVAKALMQIRDERLYREKAPTFEAYIEGTFEITLRRAQQLIALARKQVDAKPSFTQTTPPADPAPSSAPIGGRDEQLAAAVKLHRRGPRNHARKLTSRTIKGKGWSLTIKRRAGLDLADVLQQAIAKLPSPPSSADSGPAPQPDAAPQRNRQAA